jgi:thiamine-phosphate pyrophosphorylase
MCEDVVARARPYNATVIVNDRADIATLAGADGVHVGQEDLHPASVRQIVGRTAIVGVSTHSVDQVREAMAMPVDYIAVGPVFGTASKDTGYRAVGLQLVRDAARIVRDAGGATLIVAIGGLTLERAADVLRSGAASVAVISDLLSTREPEARVREYLRRLAGN